MRVVQINPKVDVITNTDNGGPLIKRKVAGYARVSTDKEEQLTSYESQITYYTNYIKNHDNWEFVDIYTDEGVSATSTRKRIGFQRMMKDAIKGKIDLIITKSISRFARNTLDSLMAIRKLKEKGIEIYFEKENIWTLDSKGELLITIMSSIAQEESRSISMNVTWGIRQSMKQGKAYVPYKVFLGYEKGPNGEMVINEEQAKLVRKIYALALQNKSTYEIAKYMEKEGIEFSKGNNKWYPSTIKSILTNEKYKGDALRQKTYTKDFLTKEKSKNSGEMPQYYIHNHHSAIIHSSIFDRLQEDLKSREIITKKRCRSYIFSKKIICPYCNDYYGPVIWHPGTSSEAIIWRCNNKYKIDDKSCLSPFINEQFIKKIFIGKISNYINKNNIINYLLKLFKGNNIVKKYLLAIPSSGLINFDEIMWSSLCEKIMMPSKEDANIILNAID